MYKFYNTNEKIQESKLIASQLKKLEATDAKVEIKEIKENNKRMYSCKISDGKLVRTSKADSPEAACDLACDAFIKDMYNNKKRLIDKKINRNRKAKELTKPPVEEEIIEK